MICIPGRTLVAFSATSVSRLISIPGEISTYSEASPASGRNPWAIVPRNAAYCGCRLSRKQYARTSMPLLIRARLPRSVPSVTGVAPAHDLPARRGADPRRPGGEHLAHVLGAPDPARRRDSELRADGLPHQQDVLERRPAGPKARRGLDEVGPPQLGQVRGDHLLLVRQKRGLDDHLVDRAGL